MRRRFGTDYLREEFDRLGAALDGSTDAYQIGGGSMAFRDLEDATKDIDLVVLDREILDRILDALTGIGYDTVRSPSDEYASLGAEAVVENEDGCRFDLFVRQVAGELVFTDGMERRSERLLEAGALTVRLVSPEDVFLFKSVAGRTDDVEDLFTLVQTGLDFEAIENELDRQTELRGEEFFVTVVNESLADLEERFGATTPIGGSVSRRAGQVYRELEVLMAIDGTTTVDEIERSTDLPQEEFDDLLDGLEAKGVIERDGAEVEQLEERP